MSIKGSLHYWTVGPFAWHVWEHCHTNAVYLQIGVGRYDTPALRWTTWRRVKLFIERRVFLWKHRQVIRALRDQGIEVGHPHLR